MWWEGSPIRWEGFAMWWKGATMRWEGSTMRWNGSPIWREGSTMWWKGATVWCEGTAVRFARGVEWKLLKQVGAGFMVPRFTTADFWRQREIRWK